MVIIDTRLIFIIAIAFLIWKGRRHKNDKNDKVDMKEEKEVDK